MLSLTRLPCLALALFTLPASLSAAVVLPYSVVASHDNLVQSSATSETQVQNASSATVITKLFSDTNARNAYFKFSLGDAMVGNHQSASFHIWSGGANSYTVSSVTNYASWQFDLYALNTGATGYNWAENSLSKASAPAYVDRALPDSSLATFVGSFTQAAVSAAGQSYEVSFHQLERFVQSDNTVTFILVTRSQSNMNPSFSFASSEHASITGPTLTIPEPSQALLAGLGLGFLVLRRRKS